MSQPEKTIRARVFLQETSMKCASVKQVEGEHEGYFVTTVGINEEVIRAYIEAQGKKDAGQTKFEIG